MLTQPRHLAWPLFCLVTATLLTAAEPPVAKSPPNLNTGAPHPVNNPTSRIMLQAPWVPSDPHQIDFAKLPRVPVQHIVVSDVRARRGVNQHNYLIHQDGRYWAMWSDGPEIEDRVGQVGSQEDF